MSRTKKAQATLPKSEWQQVFTKAHGFYLRYLITQLARNGKQLSKDKASDLLELIKKEGLSTERNSKNNTFIPEIKTDEIPFEIPANWNWCRLGSIVQHNSGKTLDSGRNSGNLREYITTSNLYWGYFRTENLRQMPIEEEELPRCLAVKGDLLICEGGEAGRAAVWEGNTSICFQNHIHRVRPYCDINSYYLFHYFKYLDFSGEINNYRKGMGISNLSGKSLSLIIVPLPPICEQKVIVDFLQDFSENTLDEGREYFDIRIENELISLHKAQIYNGKISLEFTRQLALVKELRQAYLREAMQGQLVAQDERDEPASVLLAKIKAEKEKLIAEKKIKREKPLPPIKPEEIPFTIPDNWVWCRLGEVCTKIGSGSTPRGSNYSKSGIPFFRSQNIYNEGLILDDITFISPEVHQKMEGTKIIASDILLNITGGSIGRSALVPYDFSEGNVSQHVCIIRPLCVNNSFFHKMSLSPFFQKQVFNSTTGAGREGLPKNNLEKFLIALPPLAEQKRIASKLETLTKHCDELEANIRQGSAHAETLLQVALKEALAG